MNYFKNRDIGLKMDHNSSIQVSSLALRTSDKIAELTEKIQLHIADGSWAPGYKLPTERALETEFGVARNTLRKALKKLEDAGKIIRHVGRGSFVALPAIATVNSPSLLERVIGASPSEVMEVRLLLEPWAASIASVRATVSDLEIMHECLEKASEASDILGFEIWDGKLHEAIISAAKNDLLETLYEAINAARHQPAWMKLKLRTVTDERRNMYQVQHYGIVEALKERNAAKATDLMREHLLTVRDALLCTA